MPIILDKGKEATIKVSNKSSTTTNVHWHGLSIPNNQDGPDITLNNKGRRLSKSLQKNLALSGFTLTIDLLKLK